MSRASVILSAVTLALGYTVAPVSAHWDPPDGHKMHFPQEPNGLAVYASGDMALADDWQCSGTGAVRQIHFWGLWKNDNIGEIVQFNVAICEDIPIYTDGIPYSRPGNVLWEHAIVNFTVRGPLIHDPPTLGWYDPSTGEMLWNDWWVYWQYNIVLPGILWFPQQEGTIYWLKINALVADPENTQWGWLRSDDLWNDDAAWYSQQEAMWIEMGEPAWPDVERYPYVPGDVDDDGYVNVGDLVYFTDWLYYGGPPPPYFIPGSAPPFYAAADADGNCIISTADLIWLEQFPPLWCPDYPPGPSLDLAFVIDDTWWVTIPSLTGWGVVTLLLLLIVIGIFAVRKQQVFFSPQIPCKP